MILTTDPRLKEIRAKVEAGERLSEIETVSDRLAELIQAISVAAQQQARSSETVARSMNDISQVTQQTAAGTRQASASIQNLALLAETLRTSVSMFKIDADAQSQFAAAD